MKAKPEEGSEWKALLVRLGTILAAGWLTVHGAEDKEVLAKTQLDSTEQAEGRDNAYLQYGDYVTSVLTQRAACDSALESFSRHRTDEADFTHMWKMCHSSEE